jgi:hypothetical protein
VYYTAFVRVPSILTAMETCKICVSNYTVKKGNDFPVPARESLVSDIPAGDGKVVNLFLQCTTELLDIHLADMF